MAPIRVSPAGSQRAARISTSPRATREPHGSPACRLHFTASRRQKHRRWMGIGFRGEPGVLVWSGLQASHFTYCITHRVFYFHFHFHIPTGFLEYSDPDKRADGRNGRLISFNSIFLFCDMFRHGSVTPRRGSGWILIRQKSDSINTSAPTTKSSKTKSPRRASSHHLSLHPMSLNALLNMLSQSPVDDLPIGDDIYRAHAAPLLANRNRNAAQTASR